MWGVTKRCPAAHTQRTYFRFSSDGLPVSHAILRLAFARVFDARNEWREVNTGLRRRHCPACPACPACFVPFHLFLSDFSEAHSPPPLPRSSSSCVWLSGTSRKRGEGVIVSLILPCSFRHSPATMAAVDELDNKYSMDGPAWCGRSNKSLIVLTILSVLHEREFLFLY